MDLRYFFDRRSYNVNDINCSLPLPDYVGVNGDGAKQMLKLNSIVESLIDAAKHLNNMKLVETASKIEKLLIPYDILFTLILIIF